MALLNQQLDTFVVTADCGSFRKASEELYITPTAVQKQVTILEQHLGVKLFVRTHRGLQLTSAGKVLYADGKYLIDYAQELERRLTSIGDATKYEVRAAYSPISPPLCLPILWHHIRRLDDSYTVALLMRGDDPKTKAETLLSVGSAVDVIETAYDEDRNREYGMRELLYQRIPLGVVMPTSHALTRFERVSVAQLQTTRLILPVRGLNKYADAVRNELMERGGYSVIEIEDYTVEAYNLCAREGCCMLTLNPANVHPLLTRRPVAWGHTVPYGLLIPESPSPMLADFIRLTRQVLRQEDVRRDIAVVLA